MGSNETPMMKQYRAIKQEQQDAILFFRLGDFYEMFFDDAVEASGILNLVLTSRNGHPMCGIPYHAAKSYIKRLIDAGKKVAVCEQTELPQKGKGIVRREVARVITPGTRIDEDFLDNDLPNHICAVSLSDTDFACAFADVSTGEFSLTSAPRGTGFEALRWMLRKVQPAELLVQESCYFENEEFRAIIDQTGVLVNKYPDWFFSSDDSYEAFLDHFHSVSLKQFGIRKDDPALPAAGVLLGCLKQNAKGSLSQIQQLSRIEEHNYLLLDESAQKNLELLKNLLDGSTQFTLFSVLKHTKTAAGTRRLRDWIVYPLKSLEQIRARQERVHQFYTDQILINDVRTRFSRMLDLRRLTTRILMGRSMPRDLLAIAQTVESLFALLAEHGHLRTTFFSSIPDEEFRRLEEAVEVIVQAIDSSIKGPFEEGCVIRDGYDAELDALRAIKQDSRAVLDEYLASIKRDTGITNIRLKSNKIIGYFLEVSKAQTHLVPETFLRKQTLVQGERYTTDELISLERQIYQAETSSGEVEMRLYGRIIERVTELSGLLSKVAGITAEVDCYQSLAYAAMKHGYSRPELVYSNVLQIEGGRHPIVESIMERGEFIPNDLSVEQSSRRAALITGPNMSGKSTFLRQNALIVLMAHMGSYVPADQAVIGITDAVFCRVGASDNLARGESTFLVEMNETAFILRQATESSLVIMDEVGRGTSTRDGLSIAYAVLQKLLKLRAKTLFATHYHELNTLNHPLLQKLFLDIIDDRGTIVFLKKVREGVASSSYGIHVAELAGIPADVLKTAKLHQQSREADLLQGDLFAMDPPPLVEEYPDAAKDVVGRLRRAALDSMTPRDAIAFLYELKDSLDEIEA